MRCTASICPCKPTCALLIRPMAERNWPLCGYGLPGPGVSQWVWGEERDWRAQTLSASLSCHNRYTSSPSRSLATKPLLASGGSISLGQLSYINIYCIDTAFIALYKFQGSGLIFQDHRLHYNCFKNLLSNLPHHIVAPPPTSNLFSASKSKDPAWFVSWHGQSRRNHTFRIYSEK